MDSAAVFYRRATAADPTFIQAHFGYFELGDLVGRLVQLREEYAGRTDIPRDLHRCLTAHLEIPPGNSNAAVPVFRALQEEFGSTPCIAVGLSGLLQPINAGPGAWIREQIAASRIATTAMPDHSWSVVSLVSQLEADGRVAEAIAVARAAIPRSLHILHRVRLQQVLANLLRTRGDTAEADQVERIIDRELAKDQRPFLKLVRFQSRRPVGKESTRFLEAARIAREAGSRDVEIANLVAAVQVLILAGELREPLALIEPRLAYVHEHHLYPFELKLRLQQGRALVQAGRPVEALRALPFALAAARRLRSPYYIADVYHQMVHARESRGQWREATTAADSFVAYAQRTTDPGIRTISYHDAANVQWKAGMHAAADSLSRLMVRTIARDSSHYDYAGEFYERIGDLGKAMSYYRQSAAPDRKRGGYDVKVNLAGRTRLHMALGFPDSALATARMHDSVSIAPFDEILVPGVLVAMGRTAEAVDVSRRWAALQAARGHVRGQIKSLISLAEVLASVSPLEAATAAEEADTLAIRHRFTAERITALRLRGEIAMRSGSADAVPLLADAVALARRHPDLMPQILTSVSLGEGLAGQGMPKRALAAYEDGIRLIERGGTTIVDDVTLAKFRAARAQAFDGALQSVLAVGGTRVDVAALLPWSARKKAIGSRTTTPGPITLSRVTGALRSDEALLDYLVVGGDVWVTVVTQASATLHKLPMTAGEADSLSRRIRKPMTAVYGGRIDLVRSAFDTTAARRLYDGLLRSLEPRIAGVARLIVVPDSPLHLVPFDALVTSAPAAPLTFVLDRWALRYSPSVIAATRPPPIARTASMLLVVADAPGSAAERDLVGKAWGPRTQALEGGEASEANVLRRAPRYDILHVVAHARSDERDPLASHLALRGGSTEDGLLHYAEIEKARQRHSLVVLSGCETSAGELLDGSGFMSLARAFLVGGSSAVIATQWPVGATSGPLSAAFYDHLRNGASTDEALHRAKLQIRHNAVTAHPFFWASHVLLQPF